VLQDSIWVDRTRVGAEQDRSDEGGSKGTPPRRLGGRGQEAASFPGGSGATLAGELEMVEIETVVERDDAIRDFGDRILGLFKDVVQGVVNADGWLLTAAGRKPAHQLIGDTIDTYGGDLEKIVWVNYKYDALVVRLCHFSDSHTMCCRVQQPSKQVFD
jgi:hypothetical protein